MKHIMRDAIESKILPSRDGFELVAYKIEDTDSTPFDADCYGKADIAAWRNDEWRYVGVLVTASKHGVELGCAALWSCEEGDSPGWEGYVDAFGHTLGEHEHDYDVPGDAITDAWDTIQRICAGREPNQTSGE